MAEPSRMTSRQRAIVRSLNERGFLSTTELASSLSVSDMTIRRDAKRLEETGIVRVVHGGLMLPHGTMHTPGFAKRASEESAVKRRVAVASLALIGDDDTILIDAGTTPYEVAHLLPDSFVGTIISHSAPVLQLALRRRRAGTISLGGELILDSQAFIGDLAVTSLQSLRAQSAFIGAAGITSDGVYIARNLEMPTKRAIMGAADRVILVATRSKMKQTALVHLCGFEAIDVLVTDAPPPEDIAEALEAEKVRVIIASA